MSSRGLCFSKLLSVKLQMAHYISFNSFEDEMTTWIPVVILELIHAQCPDSRGKGRIY